MADFDKYSDIISVSDIIDRFKELEGECEALTSDLQDSERELAMYAPKKSEKDILFVLENEIRVAKESLEAWGNGEEGEEIAILGALLKSMKGYGGDEQWRGDWYPSQLISANYFTEYARELVSDIGDMPREIPSYIVIDWEATAKNLLADYSEVEYEGVTFYYR